MSDVKNQVIGIISEKAGVDPEDITSESFFEDDLNIGEIELLEILEELEEVLAVELLDDKDSFQTVHDLIDNINEKLY
jgi:acyl carrier protein